MSSLNFHIASLSKPSSLYHCSSVYLSLAYLKHLVPSQSVFHSVLKLGFTDALYNKNFTDALYNKINTS